ncbi:MAG: hypothetical protein ABEI06_01895 [Halobacteriaceae archaeon]
MSDDIYSGIVGMFPYAYRNSHSRIFKSYLIIGGIIIGLISLLMVFALISIIGATANVSGGTIALSRAFFILVGLTVIMPLLTPIIGVARHLRYRENTSIRFEQRLALGGFLYIFLLYIGLIISTPAVHQQTPPRIIEPLVTGLYSLPTILGIFPPLVGAIIILIFYRMD